MLTVAVPKRNKLQNIIVLTPKDGYKRAKSCNNQPLFLSIISSKSVTFLFFLLF